MRKIISIPIIAVFRYTLLLKECSHAESCSLQNTSEETPISTHLLNSCSETAAVEQYQIICDIIIVEWTKNYIYF